jgi:predicted enzyme related to lactoylglutathione lyase
MDWPVEVPPHWSVYFTVESADESAERIRKNGGSAIMAPFDIPIGRIAIMTDAQGGSFSLFQPKASE